MPLLPGKDNIGTNIKELQATGRPRRQAIAIALKAALPKSVANYGVPEADRKQSIRQRRLNQYGK